jgi:SAM-dependent methyltransferase
MSSAATPSVRCPDCGTVHGPLAKGDRCAGCHRAFDVHAGVWDLLPSDLDVPKRNEDRVHAEREIPTWRRFLWKWHWIDAFEARWLPALVGPATRAFLEVGGGLCYTSVIVKSRLPQAFVVATDVSPRYLRQDSIRLGEFMGVVPDMYAAADAERLPFADGQFDAVYSQAVLYRVPDPVRALAEIHRVLAPGGRFVGVEQAWAALGRHRRVVDRGRRDGTGERPVTFAAWQRLVRATGLGAASVRYVRGRRIRAGALRRAVNVVRPLHVAIEITKEK